MRVPRVRIDSHRRRWPWALAAVVLAVLAGWAGRAPGPLPPAPAAKTAALTALPVMQEPMPVEPAPRPVAVRVVAPKRPDSGSQPDTEPYSEPPACASAEPDAAGGEARQRWLAAMQASSDERQRAAGWLIGLVDTNDDAVPLRDRLATLAATSRDGHVQAYAWRACRGDASLSSACQALAPDAWARIEPDNAAAWLAMAVDPRLDGQAQREALRRAAGSTRLESHGPALHALAQAAQPRGAGGLDRVMMARDIVEARADWLGSEALRQHCSDMLPADSPLAQACDALATLLATQAQSLPDLLEARETGQRVGWPAERLVALRDEEQALAALDRQRFDAPRDLSCASLAHQDAFYADVGRLGEVAALREALQRAAR